MLARCVATKRRNPPGSTPVTGGVGAASRLLRRAFCCVSVLCGRMACFKERGAGRGAGKDWYFSWYPAFADIVFVCVLGIPEKHNHFRETFAIHCWLQKCVDDFLSKHSTGDMMSTRALQD